MITNARISNDFTCITVRDSTDVELAVDRLLVLILRGQPKGQWYQKMKFPPETEDLNYLIGEEMGWKHRIIEAAEEVEHQMRLADAGATIVRRR